MTRTTHPRPTRGRKLAWLSAGLWVLVMCLMCHGAGATACGGLSAKALPSTTLDVVTRVTGGTLSAPDGPAAVRYADLPPFCRVIGDIRAARDSSVRFELWLPQSWNGRFLQVGNGGFGGAIEYEGLALGLRQGFAVASTDDGHESSADWQAGWALGHPQKVIDFGYRAVHLTARISRSMIEARYGRPPAHAYFTGCSDGGREGLMEVQRFPGDFDGWVIGAPANDWTGVMVRFLRALQSDSSRETGAADVRAGVGEQYATSFFRDFVYGDPHLDLHDLSVVRAGLDARERLGVTLNALDPDLTSVRAAGKKIIQYQGLADPVVPAGYSLAYYRAVEQYVGGDIADFYRLFMVPGMGHCHSGPGPNVFGQALVAGASFDPQHDVLAALMAWVEQDRAPQRIIATKFRGDDPRMGALETGALCPYPQVPVRARQGGSRHGGHAVCTSQP